MRRPELDQILTTMLDSQKEVSDLLFTVDRPLQVESFGELKPVAMNPPLEKLTPYQMEAIALNLIGDNLQLVEHLLKNGSCDSAYALMDRGVYVFIVDPDATKIDVRHAVEQEIIPPSCAS